MDVIKCYKSSFMVHQRFSSVGQSSRAAMIMGGVNHNFDQIKEGAIYYCGVFNFCQKFYHDHVPVMAIPAMAILTLQPNKCSYL
jgi:hypothetical protein